MLFLLNHIKIGVEHLSASGRPIILLIFSAGPVNIQFAKSSPEVVAIIQCWFPAQGAGDALYRVMSAIDGKVQSPSGRLPYTWPQSLDQVS